MTEPVSLSLFEGFGVELEYMIVDSKTLNVRPIADHVLHHVAGRYESEVERGPLAWSNELALHVLELKTNGPAGTLSPLAAQFHSDACDVNRILASEGARLMPTAMHPWMDPHTEMQLWPHEHSPFYETFDRIFDCRGHGWANLQSMHINLPFAADDEFGRLHAAIRLLLPLLPALAASSPLMDSQATGRLDNRLHVYRSNARRIPSVTGRVIPEPAYTRGDYDRQIFQPMYADIAPLDPEGILQDEFLNARGAIARFCRNTIEIRVIDVQECPQADLAICAAVVSVLRRMVSETWTSSTDQKSVPIEPLERVLLATIDTADGAVIDDAEYLRHFGIAGGSPSASELWQHLVETAPTDDWPPGARDALQVILSKGCLSRRILGRAGPEPSHDELRTVYAELCDCLAHNELLS
ncbi:Carboxylate-amine ligase YbdK [Maioricimonas rarisocia]|uniref:Carboxylate-amine ligase YbdK n=1 Tax=Maioricimonas rarisocia TaxID=2528026 RepID=A0A517Z039_9PLAN|nr:glutamate-cysteine ligase family protein [Maioricimonas rarisocia]QDU35864.1 Carboxylate-amine ligase YbdK [Maioricimonas rarisocia]